MKRGWTILGATILLSACTTGFVRPSPSDVVYLDSIVIENGVSRFPDPIHPGKLEGRIPESLNEAWSALEVITPVQPRKVPVDPENCSIEMDESLADAYVRCVDEEACKLLPAGSHIQDCGYFIRLEEWVQLNWLGGYCAISNLDKSNKLARWFVTQGIDDCSAMSELIMLGYAQRIVGIVPDEAGLIFHSKSDSARK